MNNDRHEPKRKRSLLKRFHPSVCSLSNEIKLIYYKSNELAQENYIYEDVRCIWEDGGLISYIRTDSENF